MKIVVVDNKEDKVVLLKELLREAFPQATILPAVRQKKNQTFSKWQDVYKYLKNISDDRVILCMELALIHGDYQDALRGLEEARLIRGRKQKWIFLAYTSFGRRIEVEESFNETFDGIIEKADIYKFAKQGRVSYVKNTVEAAIKRQSKSDINTSRRASPEESHASSNSITNSATQNKQSSASLVPLKIFLCHSSDDKATVRDLSNNLRADGFTPWLDEEDILPGQDWEQEIPKAVRSSDIVLVCLSHNSISKSGYVQKEIRFALDIAERQPEGAIFIIPVKLEECDLPERLRRWQWVNLYERHGYERLKKSLQARASELKRSSRTQTNLKQTTLEQDTTLARSKNKSGEQDSRLIEQGLNTFQKSSTAASWIFGSVLLIFLFWAVFFLPSPTPFQKSAIRFFMALAAAFFSLFFVGGVLLKGTLKDLFISATGGFVLFFLIQFVFDPFKISLAQLPAQTPVVNATSRPNGILVKSKSSPTIYYLESGMRHPILIPNEQALKVLGFKFEDVVMIPDAELAAIPLGPAKLPSPSPTQTPAISENSPKLEGTIWREKGAGDYTFEFLKQDRLSVDYSGEETKPSKWAGTWNQADKTVTVKYSAQYEQEKYPITLLCQVRSDEMTCEQQPSSVAINFLFGPKVLLKLK